MADSSAEDAFEDVVCYLGWWDCPRSGVALIGGKPHFFDCRFSEELDDYPDQYQVWPVRDRELADALEAWREFAQWRDQYDSGRRPPPLAVSAARERVQERSHEDPPATARSAVPEWRLDRNRSFASRVPQHKVRWAFTDAP
ncbi:MAG TPA: hypothetical protein VMA32_06085 [Streptosporangiaceae bacterium]|nr:hypothetical protein [Streptosporangiaceae bacterium]